jgi:hypothetical protein
MTTTAPAVSDGTSTVAPEKVFDAHLLQLLGVAVSPAMGAEEKGQKLSEMLMDIVIDVVSIAQRDPLLQCNAIRPFRIIVRISHAKASNFRVRLVRIPPSNAQRR